MKIVKYIFSIILVLIFTTSCTDDFGSTDFINTDVAPSNVSALFNATQDNSGMVTIVPSATGAISYMVYTENDEKPVKVEAGNSLTRVFTEGTHQIRIVAFSLTGKQTEVTLPLKVVFKAPENVEVLIENDKTVSKKVNVTVTADNAISYDVYFGENTEETPKKVNVGETISYTYTKAGTYDIKIIVKGAAIATVEKTQKFEVTEILQPVKAAITPVSRASADVISIFSDKYVATTVDTFAASWSAVTKQEEVMIDNNPTLVYRELNYAGIITEKAPINASAMEFIHLDIWSTNVNAFKIKFVDFNGTGYNGGADNIEFEIEKPITEKGKWISIDIPLADFKGVPFTDINQIVIVADPVGTVFIDNFYFWRKETEKPTSSSLPLTFELDYDISSFDGGEAMAISNPKTEGNSSANVLKLVKGGGQPWAGSKVSAKNPFKISEGMNVTAKVWSPRAGLKLLMKFEDTTTWPNTKATAETVAETTVANAWQELTFTITGVDTAIEYSNLVLIMDNGTMGDGSENFTIYIDDISVATFLNFEKPFHLDSFDGGSAKEVKNPDTNGNPSSKVLQLIKGQGQPWAGLKIVVNTPFALVEGTKITAKVWSPRAGLKLLMKFEDATPWPNTKATAETIVETTVANAWQELTFTITGVDTAVEYSNLVLIMDNGTMGDGSENFTIYVDDISQGV